MTCGRPEDVPGRPATGPRKSLVLGGGGLLGAMYEIGCLATIEREVPERLRGVDLYVGTSGGAVVASLLAAGYSATELRNMVDVFTPPNLCRLDWARLAGASLRLPFRVARRALASLSGGAGPISGSLAVLQEVVPAGLLNLRPLEDFLRERLRVRGVMDVFESLPGRLLVPAIDLDTGERIVFGDADTAGARVSTAVAASCAIPRFFHPVRWEDRDLVDGGIADSLNLDLALERGASEVLVVDPLVAPLNDRQTRCLPSREGGCGHVAEQGLVAALGQAMKMSHMIHAGTSFRLHRLTYPDTAVEVIQPDRLEVELDNPMDFRGRERLLALGEKDGRRSASRRSASRSSATGSAGSSDA